MSENTKQICCICGKEFVGWGNNPDPIKDKDGELFPETAKCCDYCNANIVVPTRIAEFYEGNK